MEGRREGMEIGRMREMINTEKEKQCADELEKKNARLRKLAIEHGIVIEYDI